MLNLVSLPTSKVSIPFIENETVREFNLRIEEKFERVIAADQTTSYLALYKSGILINHVNNRHKLLQDVIDIDKQGETKIICRLFSTPNVCAFLEGNLLTGGLIADTNMCAICLEDFDQAYSTNDSTLFISLDCFHRFHVKCLAKQQHFLCAMCSSPISEEKIRFILVDRRSV